MTLNDFFHACEDKSSYLFREFIWILTEKFDIHEVDLISGQHQLSLLEQESLTEWCQKRSEDYPLQYFIGSTQFMGETFAVSDGVLIPRMETEEIARWVVEKTKTLKVKTIMDIGSGSGCLGIGVALNSPNLEDLVLIEPFGDGSLLKNAQELCGQRAFNVELFDQSFEKYEFKNKFDLILSNPPYIRFGDPDVAKGVYEYEPHEALFGGDDGWEKVISWVEKSYDWLSDQGLLVFEISHDQRSVVENKLQMYFPKVHQDSFGKDRFFVIEKAKKS